MLPQTCIITVAAPTHNMLSVLSLNTSCMQGCWVHGALFGLTWLCLLQQRGAMPQQTLLPGNMCTARELSMERTSTESTLHSQLKCGAFVDQEVAALSCLLQIHAQDHAMSSWEPHPAFPANSHVQSPSTNKKIRKCSIRLQYSLKTAYNAAVSSLCCLALCRRNFQN